VTRAWIPLVVVIVVTLAGFAVYRIHGVVGPGKASTDIIDESKPVIPKDVIYQVFGPEETTGQVNYLDENSQPQHADFTTLPWSYTISTKLTSIFANLVAQGDSGTIGCRIIVNGEVRDEQTVNTHDAQVFCLVKSA
jgi:hypothetical protein